MARTPSDPPTTARCVCECVFGYQSGMLWCVFQEKMTSANSMASALLHAGHTIFVNLMTPKEWQDLGATHEEDLVYKAADVRVEFKRKLEVACESQHQPLCPLFKMGMCGVIRSKPRQRTSARLQSTRSPRA